MDTSLEFGHDLEKEAVNQKFKNLFLVDKNGKSYWDDQYGFDYYKNLREEYEKMPFDDRERLTKLVEIIESDPDYSLVIEGIRFPQWKGVLVPKDFVLDQQDYDKLQYHAGYFGPLIIHGKKDPTQKVGSAAGIKRFFKDKRCDYNSGDAFGVIVRQKPKQSMFLINMDAIDARSQNAEAKNHAGGSPLGMNFNLVVNRSIGNEILNLIEKNPNDFMHIYRALCFKNKGEVFGKRYFDKYGNKKNDNFQIINEKEIIEVPGIERQIYNDFFNEGIPEYDAKKLQKQAPTKKSGFWGNLFGKK